MTIISAALFSTSGKLILSRQFVDISRSKIENLLAAFPRLLTKGSERSLVDHDGVRYLYNYVDELVVVLVTTTSSNVISDMETLKAFTWITVSFCKKRTVIDAHKQAFELLSIYGDLVTLGERESIHTYAARLANDLESQEERIQDSIRQSKELNAEKSRQEEIKKMDMQRKEAARKKLSSAIKGHLNNLTSGSSSRTSYNRLSSGSSQIQNFEESTYHQSSTTFSASPMLSSSQSSSGVTRSVGMRLGH